MKLNMRSDGYVDINQLMKHSKFRGVDLNDIFDIVENNDKKRFEITNESNGMFIRAVQGHTIKTISDDELLTPILDATEYPLVVHGTYKNILPTIQTNGLSRMKRNHIHMATSINPSEVTSGVRNNVEVYIVIDMEKAINDGILFYRSTNGVILSPGITENGMIPPQYFKEIIYRENL